MALRHAVLLPGLTALSEAAAGAWEGLILVNGHGAAWDADTSKTKTSEAQVMRGRCDACLGKDR